MKKLAYPECREAAASTKVKPKAPGKRSKHTEAQLLLQMHLKELGLETELEFMFHSIRRWRFDLACLEHRIAFECNGHFQGKHGAGWSSDAEKINMAQVIGWRVFVFSNREVLNGQAKMWVKHNLTDVPMLSDALAIEACQARKYPKAPLIGSQAQQQPFVRGVVMENKPMQPTDAPNERPVLEAAENMDWRQVFLHGGSPCFHLNVKRKRFCGRAKEWPGHLADEFQDHIYVSLENLLAALASPSSAEHAPAGPLRRMREAVECVRHEGNDLGECWMDCRRCRLEKELAALAATNAQPATSRAEGPASDALNALVAEKRQLIMDVINTARNGKWNNLVDNAADYALNGFESAVRESAVRDAALTSQPSAEYAPAPEPDKQARVEKGELRSARGFEEWWDNWILGQKKPYNALTKTDMEICWKSAQREVALAGEPSESAALADQPAATPAQLRSALERMRRTPAKPFPDAGAHSWRAFGEAVWEAWAEIQRIADALAAQPAPARPERELLAGWMMQHSFATGHGDTVEDLLKELDWQVEELRELSARNSRLKRLDQLINQPEPNVIVRPDGTCVPATVRPDEREKCATAPSAIPPAAQPATGTISDTGTNAADTWRAVIVGLPIIRKLMDGQNVELESFKVSLIPDDVLWNGRPERAPTPAPATSAEPEDVKWPAIPSHLINPIVFLDSHLGLAMVAGVDGEQWVYKAVQGNTKWMSVRKVDGRDPLFIATPLNRATLRQPGTPAPTEGK